MPARLLMSIWAVWWASIWAWISFLAAASAGLSWAACSAGAGAGTAMTWVAARVAWVGAVEAGGAAGGDGGAGAGGVGPAAGPGADRGVWWERGTDRPE